MANTGPPYFGGALGGPWGRRGGGVTAIPMVAVEAALSAQSLTIVHTAVLRLGNAQKPLERRGVELQHMAGVGGEQDGVVARPTVEPPAYRGDTIGMELALGGCSTLCAPPTPPPARVPCHKGSNGAGSCPRALVLQRRLEFSPAARGPRRI